MMYKAIIYSAILSSIVMTSAMAQRIPSAAEDITFLSTFSADAEGKWGDDDHVQVYFIAIPENNTEPFYLRIFDPEIGGAFDMANGAFDSKTSFTLYGGKGAYSTEASRGINPEKGYDAGQLIATKTFANDPEYNKSWYTFGPINPKEGEPDALLGANVFKLIVKGLSGNDGNLYSMYLSTKAEENKAVAGSNAFAYEISFRIPQEKNVMGHLYPYVDEDVVAVKIYSFDFDKGGAIRLTSNKKKEHRVKSSGDNAWVASEHQIISEEKETSLDIHFIPKASFANDVTMYITNQYGKALPFFTNPINGIPKYIYRVSVEMTTD